MDNQHKYVDYGFRPLLNADGSRHQHRNIPYDSSESQTHPSKDAFQNYQLTEGSSSQQSSRLSGSSTFNQQLPRQTNSTSYQQFPRLVEGTPHQQSPATFTAFHSPRYPPPDMSYPPPPVEVWNQRNTMPCGSDFKPQSSKPPNQNYGYSSDPSSTLGTCNQTTLQAPNRFASSHNVTNSSLRFPSPGMVLDTSHGTGESNEMDDQTWLVNFEQGIVNRQGRQPSENVSPKKKPLKLMEVQQLVSRSQVLNDRLMHLKEKMKISKADAKDHVWYEYIEEAEKIKVELHGITSKFQDSLFVDNVLQLIQQRRRKRKKEKRRQKQKSKYKEELRELKEMEERKIDAWREELHVKEVEKRREQAIKAEADSILGEVRQKQVDGLKMQQLLEGLISLRIARLNKGATHGFMSTPQQDQLFTTTIKNITDVVNTQMGEYELEEQTLRVMMEESTSYQRSNAGKQPKDKIKKLEASMEEIFFGKTPPIDQETYKDFTAADCCLETLIQRRYEWDQFLCDEDLPMASSVPLKWVTPPSQPKAPWDMYQGQNK